MREPRERLRGYARRGRARALPAEIRDRAQEVPWSKILGMRHILVHDYFSIDRQIVWDVVERDLPDLKRKVERLLADLSGQA